MFEIVGKVKNSLRLDRETLASLPGQLPDISERLPGRQGRGVALSSVLDLAQVEGDAGSLRLTSGDGKFSADVEIPEALEAILVFELDGRALPRSSGGPVRFFLHDAETCRGHGDAPCANVKDLGKIEVRT